MIHGVEQVGSRHEQFEADPLVVGAAADAGPRTVDVHVAWLRQKVEPTPRYPQFILTVHGMGYKFAG